MNQPAPNFYQNVYEDTKNKRYKINHQSSCFSSNTERMKQNIDANKILPGPGHYDTSLSYQQSQTHQSKAKPRNKHAEKKNNSFLSNEKRFSLIYDSKSNLTDVNLPAPNKYNIKNCDKSKNIISSKKKRFDINNNSNPPPNIYTFHPLHTNSVLKGTFNVTLNNPVIKELETIDESSEIEQNPMKQLLFGV
ncbi:hypothetical protein A3Q56_08670 [Intoshia linei]|uniref:Uncharacterized protein n=1 Tax=Intoshia linei TaxID=1819745 RepID=A0A177ANL5_9BILA|nr:hypothetical protein A3Q56_08670 [Intoshia linei]